jgi:CRISPR/Cas system CMR-associated protein Cmr5 small subunit
MLKKMNKNTLQMAIAFLNIKLDDMSESDRIAAFKEAKEHVLKINEIYKKTKEPVLLKLIASIVIIKYKIEKSIDTKKINDGI